MKIAYEIIDAQDRLIKAMERGHWKNREDLAFLEDTKPVLEEYRHKTGDD